MSWADRRRISGFPIVGGLDSWSFGTPVNDLLPGGSMTGDHRRSSLRPEMTLLVSRISGRGRAERYGLEVARILRGAGWSVEVIFTDAADDPQWMAEHAGSRLVGAIGGDGYLAATGRGVALGNTGRVLVPFPGGTGNDLCRALGVGLSLTGRAKELAALVEGDLDAAVRSIDGMWVRGGKENGDQEKKEHLAFGVVSLGIDASANILSNQSSLRGSLSYIVGAVRAFFSQSHQRVLGFVDGKDYDFTGWIASVSNSGWIGGGINLVPDSNLDDGLLEVFNVGPTGRLRVVPLLIRVLAHLGPKSPLVNLVEGREVRLESDVALPAMADGDLVAYTPVTVRVAPGILPVLTQ